MSPWRHLKRVFGISAQRVAVRPDVPWYWQIAVVAFFVLAVGWAAFTMFGRDSDRADSERELSDKRYVLERQNIELAELRSKLAHAERQVEMDRAAAADLGKQVKSLTFENAKLNEYRGFFQSLLWTAGGR
jgi:hypothetical protein